MEEVTSTDYLNDRAQFYKNLIRMLSVLPYESPFEDTLT